MSRNVLKCKSSIFFLSIAVALVSFFSLFSCSATLPKQMTIEDAEVPIAVHAGQTYPIAFKGIVINVPAGKEIGSQSEGLFKTKRYPNYWDSTIGIGSTEFSMVALDKLRNTGYSVLGGQRQAIEQTEAAKATFQVEGTISNIRYDTFGDHAGNNAMASIVVDWTIYNSIEKRIVFQFSAEGIGKLPDESGNVIMAAFKDAVDKVLALPGFMLAVKVNVNLDSHALIAADRINYRPECVCDSALLLPHDIDQALKSITTVYSEAGIGSGVMISSDGFMLTASHVVTGGSWAKVQLQSGKIVYGTVLRVDIPNDIALVRVPGSGYSCLPLAIDSPLVGNELFAIGSPLGPGLSHSVAKGIVSGLRRFYYSDYIQTDVSLNPGNSGGPLLNIKGEIVGIVSWKIVGTRIEGLAFGVPAATIRRLLGISQTTTS